MSEKPIPPAAPAVYATMLPGLQEVARAHGYALAVHGSMQRDFDLIAVPWVADAKAADELAEAMRDYLGGAFSLVDPNGFAGIKPHGRRCWIIHLRPPDVRDDGERALGWSKAGGYVDLSVTPRAG